MSFVALRKYAFIFSAVLIIAGVISMSLRGLNFGIDFTGGTLLHLNIRQEFTLEEARGVLAPLGLEAATLQKVGAEGLAEGEKLELLIQTQQLTPAEQDDIFSAFQEKYELTADDLLRVENVAPVVGGELQRQALIALLLAGLGMIAYITIRFEFRFAVSAIAALLHDLLVMLAFFSLFQIEVNGPFIAAVLTVLGYSINDTIVIYDRIRENLKTRRKEQFADVVDNSIRQSLVRAINTSVTTLIVVVTILVFGGITLYPFMLALLVGVFFGTYSSVFIASPIWLVWKEREMRKHLRAKSA
ncbi:MAG: protein translocase subunit SecF [Dethiobacter sp.]|jgi:preprotein translocase SecF subunit|nr:protein translocase subunit SecF [Dethiobacter sp.]MBS3900788.1 protein translocase subunit SecF [Dethiobacter sp.]MBS3988764.1 protein translocase subunit SecF [Dethiobacter sp.]